MVFGMTQSADDGRTRILVPLPLPLGWAAVAAVWGGLFVLLEGHDLLNATAWSLLWWWSGFKVLLGVLGFAVGVYSAVVALRPTAEVTQ
jgi:hypothetical protein